MCKSCRRVSRQCQTSGSQKQRENSHSSSQRQTSESQNGTPGHQNETSGHQNETPGTRVKIPESQVQCKPSELSCERETPEPKNQQRENSDPQNQRETPGPQAWLQKHARYLCAYPPYTNLVSATAATTESCPSATRQSITAISAGLANAAHLGSMCINAPSPELSRTQKEFDSSLSLPDTQWSAQRKSEFSPPRSEAAKASRAKSQSSRSRETNAGTHSNANNFETDQRQAPVDVIQVAESPKQGGASQLCSVLFALSSIKPCGPPEPESPAERTQRPISEESSSGPIKPEKQPHLMRQAAVSACSSSSGDAVEASVLKELLETSPAERLFLHGQLEAHRRQQQLQGERTDRGEELMVCDDDSSGWSFCEESSYCSSCDCTSLDSSLRANETRERRHECQKPRFVQHSDDADLSEGSSSDGCGYEKGIINAKSATENTFNQGKDSALPLTNQNTTSNGVDHLLPRDSLENDSVGKISDQAEKLAIVVVDPMFPEQSKEKIIAKPQAPVIQTSRSSETCKLNHSAKNEKPTSEVALATFASRSETQKEERSNSPENTQAPLVDVSSNGVVEQRGAALRPAEESAPLIDIAIKQSVVREKVANIAPGGRRVYAARKCPGVLGRESVSGCDHFGTLEFGWRCSSCYIQGTALTSERTNQNGFDIPMTLQMTNSTQAIINRTVPDRMARAETHHHTWQNQDADNEVKPAGTNREGQVTTNASSGIEVDRLGLSGGKMEKPGMAAMGSDEWMGTMGEEGWFAGRVGRALPRSPLSDGAAGLHSMLLECCAHPLCENFASRHTRPFCHVHAASQRKTPSGQTTGQTGQRPNWKESEPCSVLIGEFCRVPGCTNMTSRHVIPYCYEHLDHHHDNDIAFSLRGQSEGAELSAPVIRPSAFSPPTLAPWKSNRGLDVCDKSRPDQDAGNLPPPQAPQGGSLPPPQAPQGGSDPPPSPRDLPSVTADRCALPGCVNFASRFTHPVCYEHLDLAPRYQRPRGVCDYLNLAPNQRRASCEQLLEPTPVFCGLVASCSSEKASAMRRASAPQNFAGSKSVTFWNGREDDLCGEVMAPTRLSQSGKAMDVEDVERFHRRASAASTFPPGSKSGEKKAADERRRREIGSKQKERKVGDQLKRKTEKEREKPNGYPKPIAFMPTYWVAEGEFQAAGQNRENIGNARNYRRTSVYTPMRSEWAGEGDNVETYRRSSAPPLDFERRWGATWQEGDRNDCERVCGGTRGGWGSTWDSPEDGSSSPLVARNVDDSLWRVVN